MPRTPGYCCSLIDGIRVWSVIHSYERADLVDRIQTVGNSFPAFSKSWEASGVCEIASTISNFVLAAVPQDRGRQMGSLFLADR